MFERSKRIVISMAISMVFLVVGCTQRAPAQSPSTGSEPSVNADGYIDLTVEQLADMMDKEDLTLINVHIPYAGDLPDTDLSIPFDQIAQRADELPDKDAPIVLYCRSGSMSTSAAKELAELGYTKIMELDGGMVAWKAAGHDLVTE